MRTCLRRKTKAMPACWSRPECGKEALVIKTRKYSRKKAGKQERGDEVTAREGKSGDGQ